MKTKTFKIESRKEKYYHTGYVLIAIKNHYFSWRVRKCSRKMKTKPWILIAAAQHLFREMPKGITTYVN